MGAVSLADQTWYWGSVDKATVSHLMHDQPDGAFMVRDASSPGDYTLTIKYGGQSKLVRIHVCKGRCGFAVESLTHDSVVGLIEFHRTRSLKVYNEQLDVILKYPLSRWKNALRIPCKASSISSSSASLPSPPPPIDPDWELRLGLERLRISQTAAARSARLFDAVHAEVQRAEDLHHALTKTMILIQRSSKHLKETVIGTGNIQSYVDNRIKMNLLLV
uniref:SH2 domain-containing protein n=1 Tax=Heterorhabditis bacteriophora TaxID=37862 RepID=A0A1I7XCJ8_HETBA